MSYKLHFLEKFATTSVTEPQLKLKHYGDADNDDFRLYYIHQRKKGYEREDKSKSKEASVFTEEEKRAESERCSLSRAKQEIIDIARSNSFKYFVTLTVSSSSCDRYSLEECHYLLKKLMKEYARRCTRYNINFKYLLITEKHEDGAFHFHGLFTNLLSFDIIINENNYPTSKFFSSKLGHFSFSKIKNLRRVSLYITKYITKCPIKSLTNRLYFCSKGLARAEVFDLPLSADDYEFLKKFWSFDNEYVKIKDFSYNKLDRKYQIFLSSKPQ